MPTNSPFLERKSARHFDRLIVGDLDYLVVQVGVEHVGNKTAAQSLNLVRPGLAARKHCTVAWLNGDGLELRLTLLNVL